MHFKIKIKHSYEHVNSNLFCTIDEVFIPDIEQKLAELGGRERTAHLEEVLQELRSQEQRNEEVLHQLSSHITSMKG